MTDRLRLRLQQCIEQLDAGRDAMVKAQEVMLGQAARIAALEAQAAPVAPAVDAQPVACLICNSTGNATPCAYPTEINRQQAARIERLRKGLFEARDAMRVMSNWVTKSDPAGHSWAVRMVDCANDILNHAPTTADSAQSEGWRKDAVRRETLEEAASAALNASLHAIWADGRLMDPREVGSACAAAIRALSQKE